MVANKAHIADYPLCYMVRTWQQRQQIVHYVTWLEYGNKGHTFANYITIPKVLNWYWIDLHNVFMKCECSRKVTEKVNKMI